MSATNGILPTSDGHHDREDAKLAAMAVRKGWIIPEGAFSFLPGRALRMAAEAAEANDSRKFERMSRLVREYHKDNIEAESKPQPNLTINSDGGIVFNILPAAQPHLNGHANGVADAG